MPPRIPAYYLTRPPLSTDAATLGGFDALYERCRIANGGFVDYALDVPIWQFLCHIADTRDVLLHGSNQGDIEEFEPRTAGDPDPFCSLPAVYAASDGIWPLYFAVLDRSVPMWMVNGCLRLRLPDASEVGPYYYFSVSRPAVERRAFRDGTVYLLPRATFEPYPEREWESAMILATQWRSHVPVAPMARLRVHPEDFPFLHQLRAHDDAILAQRVKDYPEGWPWVTEGEE
jgi:hypothetical protein